MTEHAKVHLLSKFGVLCGRRSWEQATDDKAKATCAACLRRMRRLR